MSFAKRGDEGLHVTFWQLFLIGQNIKKSRADGQFGPKTEDGTKEFQKKGGLEQTGEVDDDTLKLAKELGFKPPVIGKPDFTTVTDFTARVPRPPTPNRPGLTGATNATMLDILGEPCELTEDCRPIDNDKVADLLVIRDVGPFRVHGLKPAVEVLERVFKAVKQKLPALHDQLGTEGMLCCRLVRGGSTYSNHSFGTAIDITINGILDRFGDGNVLLGTWALAEFFNDEMFYWGAGFSREDGMHFEASNQLVKKWHKDGII